MKSKILVILYFILMPALVYSQVNLNTLINSITIADIKTHIDTLAYDYMEGRMTGEDGQKKAAKYISDYFEKANLTPLFPENENPYYQKFNLNTYEVSTSSFFYRDLKYNAPVFFSTEAIVDSIFDSIYFCGYAAA